MGLTMSLYASNDIQTLELMQNVLKVNGSFKTEQLFGGCSGSKVIKVGTPEKTYVVRFWNMQWVDDFPQDLACQLIASDAGYGPKVYFVDEIEGITVMDYHCPEALPEITIKLQRLVDLLKKIHKGPEVPKGIDRSVYLDLLIEETKSTQFFDFEALRNIKNTVFTATRPSASCVACHRDLHHGNLIYTQGRFYAIDYTWGAMDDPYADLANIAIFNCQTQEEGQVLLQLYLGYAPSRVELARLALMKLPAKMFYGLEFLGLANAGMTNKAISSQAKPKSYMKFGQHNCAKLSSAEFLEYSRTLIDEVIEYTKSAQYKGDLEEVVVSKKEI